MSLVNQIRYRVGRQLLELKTCSKCGSDKTGIAKNRNRNPCEHWYHDNENNIICNKCYLNEYYSQHREYLNSKNNKWKKDNPEHVKISSILYLPRQTQLNRIHRVIKRGYGWTS